MYSITQLPQYEYPGLLVCFVVSTPKVLVHRFADCTDLIPPIVELTSFPSAVSRQTEWLFRFQCIGEVQCTFRCSVHVVGDLAQFEDCNDGQWLAAELQNNVQYELSLVATDAVGNIGQLHTYKWTVGE